ncbi:MAG: hypothetical protein Kow0090_15090 [Myxococcota bacterium]
MPQCFFDGFFGERKAKKAIADFFPPALQKPGYREEGAAWDSAFRSQLHWVSFLPDSLSEFFQSALFSIVAPGVASLEDSAQKLKNVLRDRISMSRGRTMEGIRISGLAFDGKKLVGVKWEGEEHFFASKIVIWCESPKLVLDMLPESFRRKKPFLAIEALSPLGFWATHRFPVNEDALPLGLCDRLAFVEADEKYPIILQREFQPAESGETVFNLSLYLPYKGETEKELWQRLEPLFESALKRVKGVMPFAKIGACASKKDEIMRSLFPVYPPKSDCPMGITAYSPLTTVPNLLLGGPHLWPSLGMVGELMLGQQLAMICVEKLSK